MKHKVKLVKVVDDVITLRVDGVLCAYLIQRPQPLSFADAALLRGVMDTSLLKVLTESCGWMMPQSRLRRWFLGLIKLGVIICVLSMAAVAFSIYGFLAFHDGMYVLGGVCGIVGFVCGVYMCREKSSKQRVKAPLFSVAVADYIEKVCIEVDISEKVKSFVLLKSDIDKIRKGEIYET